MKFLGNDIDGRILSDRLRELWLRYNRQVNKINRIFPHFPPISIPVSQKKNKQRLSYLRSI